jgi:hypothetical protein
MAMTQGKCAIGEKEYVMLLSIYEIATLNGEFWQNAVIRIFCMKINNYNCAYRYAITFRNVANILLKIGYLKTKKFGRLTIYYPTSNITFTNLLIAYINAKVGVYAKET